MKSFLYTIPAGTTMRPVFVVKTRPARTKREYPLYTITATTENTIVSSTDWYIRKSDFINNYLVSMVEHPWNKLMEHRKEYVVILLHNAKGSVVTTECQEVQVNAFVIKREWMKRI